LIAIGSVEFMQFSVTDNEKVKLHGMMELTYVSPSGKINFSGFFKI